MAEIISLRPGVFEDFFFEPDKSFEELFKRFSLFWTEDLTLDCAGFLTELTDFLTGREVGALEDAFTDFNEGFFEGF